MLAMLASAWSARSIDGDPVLRKSTTSSDQAMNRSRSSSGNPIISVITLPGNG